MQTTQEQIRERLALLPETRLQEVLLFVDFLVSRLRLPLDFGQKGDAQVMHYGEEKGDDLKQHLPLYQYASDQYSQ